LVGDRVFAKKSMTSSIENHPFIVFKLGYKADEEFSEDPTKGRSRQFAQIWVHDYSDSKTGDYMRIDDVMKQIRIAFEGQGSAEHGVIMCKFLEVSQDLDDDTLNTVFKYARLQLMIEERS
jgi:hypothetical protein